MKQTIMLFFTALFLKIIFFFQIIKYDPSLKFPQIDSAYFLEISSNLKEGKWIPEPEGFYLLPPGYSYFLSLIPYNTGNFKNIFLIQIFLGALAVVLIKILGTNIFGKKVGTIAALFFLFYGPSTFYEVKILSESIFSFFFLLFLFFYFSQKKLLQFISGFFLGFLCILRQNFLLFWIFFFLWILFKERNKLFVLILSLPLIFIIPVVNFIGTGKFLGTSAQGGIALYMGNNPYSYGLFSDPIGLRGNLHQMAKQVQIYTEKEAKKNLSPLEINFYWAKKVFVWAKENPMDFLRNFIFKIQRFMDNWEYGINEQWIWGSPKITYLFPLPFALIISAGIMGLILSIKSKENFPFFLFFLSQLLVLLIFFPSSRHRFPLIPVLCLWSGLFLDRFFSLERRKKIFHLTFFLLILFFSIIGVPDERRKPDPFINYNQSIASLSLGDLEKANYWIEEALKGNWAVPFFHSAKAKIYYLQGKKDKGIREKWYAFYLGESEAQLLNELGKWSLEKKKFKAAERVFKRSVEVYPKSGASAINLAQVLFLQGKREEAKIWYQKGISLGGMPNPYLEKTFKNLEENSKKKN